jgi:hypothetical protein
MFSLENLKGRGHLENPGVGKKVVLKWVLGKWGGWCEMATSGSGQGQMPGTCEHNNEYLGFIKGREFLDQLSDSYLPKEDSPKRWYPIMSLHDLTNQKFTT